MSRNFQKKIVFLLFLIIFAVLIWQRLEVKDEFEFKETDISYYEFVYEDTTCETNCFIEYIVHSNGVVLVKKETIIGEERKTEVNLGTIDKEKAQDLINNTKNLMRDLSNSGVSCADCRLYHLFYGDLKETRSFTTYFDNAPDFIDEINRYTESAIKDIKLIEPFFVHFVFQPIDGNSIDYHFYPEGTVLKEEFGKKNGELLLSAIYSLNPQEVNNMKNSVTNNYFNSVNNMAGCPENDLLWGYLEIKKGDSYKTVYTCGRGKSEADKLFKELLGKVKGK